MNRHASLDRILFQTVTANEPWQDDLELPHVPHLTTVTSTITPTAALRRWRRDHPERYRTKLSDHAPAKLHARSSSMGLRNRKDWTIEYTMYASSRDGGTQPFRRIKAQEFHQLQWESSVRFNGEVAEKRSVDTQSGREMSNPDKIQSFQLASETSYSVPDIFKQRRESKNFFDKISSIRPLTRRSASMRRRTITLANPSDSQDLTRTYDQNLLGSNLGAIMDEREIPNANFARKFGIFAGDGALPPSIKELPVAEDQALDAVIASPGRGRFFRGSHGPFTPQLWFDGGLDYRWKWR